MYFHDTIPLDAEKPEVTRNPAKAITYLERACSANHAPSCYNLAVLFKKGDKGVEPDQKKFEEFRDRTNTLITQFGGISGRKIG